MAGISTGIATCIDSHETYTYPPTRQGGLDLCATHCLPRPWRGEATPLCRPSAVVRGAHPLPPLCRGEGRPPLIASHLTWRGGDPPLPPLPVAMEATPPCLPSPVARGCNPPLASPPWRGNPSLPPLHRDDGKQHLCCLFCFCLICDKIARIKACEKSSCSEPASVRRLHTPTPITQGVR